MFSDNLFAEIQNYNNDDDDDWVEQCLNPANQAARLFKQSLQCNDGDTMMMTTTMMIIK